MYIELIFWQVKYNIYNHSNELVNATVAMYNDGEKRKENLRDRENYYHNF